MACVRNPPFACNVHRMQRGTLVPRLGRTRSLRQLRHGVSDAVPGGYRRQLERHHERRAARGLRRRGGLREKLLRGHRHSTDVFRHIRADGAVRVGQRGRRGADETSGRIAQTGKTDFVDESVRSS